MSLFFAAEPPIVTDISSHYLELANLLCLEKNLFCVRHQYCISGKR